MGQVLEKFKGKEWKQKQIRKITDKVFDRFKNETGRVNLTFEDLYIAVLLIFNDINKRLPGPHFDPPSKEQVRDMMQRHDLNLDGELNREEFVAFISQLTKDTFITVSQGLIITLAVAPTLALLTKRTTEGVPVVGKVVEKLPSSIYASLVTLTIVLVQQAAEAKQ
nr:Calcium-binding protein [Ipomoea batatas]